MSKQLSLSYHKVTIPDLSKADRVGELSHIQSYNPVYSLFFDVNERTYDKICFSQAEYIVDAEHVVNENKETLSRKMHIKSAPLIDPIHYLIGKYKDQNKKWLNLPQYGSSDTDCMEKLLSPNNTSYVDTFFNFLSSQVLTHYDFQHGIQFYGSFLGIQKKFVFNAYDDIEYLQESEYFLQNNKCLYEVEDDDDSSNEKSGGSHNQNTQQNRPRLILNENLESTILDDVVELVNVSDVSTTITETIEKEENDDLELVYEQEQNSDDDEDESDTSSINYSTDDNGENVEEEENESDESGSDESESDESGSDDEEENDSDSSSSHEFLPLYIYDFPVQMIALEKCDGTIDELIEENKIEEAQMFSALIQVIFTLLAYQKMFSLTHNDLHTNNIVYKTTTEKYLYYCVERKYYKVPTYGRVFKIIDFGRSIYRFQDKLFCSDSFSPDGDANGQYNTEPYLNLKKSRLEPNHSFDLCRLGCSLYNFYFEPDEPLPKKMTPLQSLVHSWCIDDNNMNILYKRNGEERYPNFKLYKMIARLVHNKTPKNQLSLPVFKGFEIDKAPKGKQNRVMNIDSLPVLYSG